MAQIFDINYDAPTLIYPNGGEIISEGTLSIRWKEPSGIPTSQLVWYELFLFEDFINDNISPSIQIAVIPSGTSSFTYKIPKNIKGTRCRIGIRAVDHHGGRSQSSYSSANFSITGKRVPRPALFEPIPGETYFSHLPVVFDHSAILGRCSQRSLYYLSYKCDSLGIDWSEFRSNIMVGSMPFEVDVSKFATASDYDFKAELFDGENVSEPVFINGVTINNINYFLIDTLPPVGSVKIIDNTEYTNERNLLLKIDAYDDTSAVKEFRIEQTNVGVEGDGASITGSFVPLSDISTWNVGGGDGVKLIQARLKDYADNVVSDSATANFLRTYKSLDNKEITAFLNNGADNYIAFEAGENEGDYAQLYKNQNLLSTLGGNATALAFYGATLYIAISDNENKGILQRYVAGSIQTVRDNSNPYADTQSETVNSLYDADSVIKTMAVYDDKLFMGLQNGKLLSFNGSSTTVENSTYEGDRVISYLFTDNSLLYMFFDNTTDVSVMYKNDSGIYTFTTVNMGE
jgi:hypothetical protein